MCSDAMYSVEMAAKVRTGSKAFWTGLTFERFEVPLSMLAKKLVDRMLVSQTNSLGA
jgi:hypothetical protein